MQEDEQLLTVRINRATDVVWEGYAHSLSSANAQGPFDILPMHANFLTLIRDTPIEIQATTEGKVVYKFPVSVLHVANNVVRIYAEIG
jgi:F0F1-type ATP synthase epsilon subunit